MRGDGLVETPQAGFLGWEGALTGCARAHSCCGSLEEAAINELVAQLVEQRPFNPNLAIISQTLESSISATIY